MKNLHHGHLGARLIAGLALLTATNALAVDHEATVASSEAASFAVSNADLLQTAFASYNGSDLSDAPGAADTNFLAAQSPNGEASLRDGVWQDINSPAQGRGAAMVQNDEFAEFNLDLTASPGGYTINGIDLYSNWGNGQGRDKIRVNVSFSLVGTPTVFDQILVEAGNPLFEYNPPTLTQGKVSLSGFSVPGVAAIRFDWPATQETSAVGYSEIDVFGVAATDLDPPTLSNSTPANGASNVPTIDDLVFNFNEDIQAGTGTIELRTVSPDALVEAFDVTSSPQLSFGSPSARDLTINPTTSLTTGDEYYLLVPSGAIEDLAGNDFAGFLAPPDATAFTFTTDNTPPALPGAELLLNLLPSADLTIKFDELVALGTGTITIHLASDDSVVQTINIPADATVNGDTISVDIADLAFGTDYYLNVSAGAITDVSGNTFPAVNDNATLAFATVSDVPAILIHHWEFEGDATDSVGTHDGTLNGGAGYAEGRFGDALNTTGGGALMLTASLPATDFTATCWIKPTELTATRHIIGTRSGSTAGAMLRLTGGVPTVTLQSESTVQLAATAPVPAGEWTHLAYTVDSTNGLTLYVNGSPVASDALGTGHTVFNNFSVGRRPDTALENYIGQTDDVRIYAEVLSQSEIETLAGTPGQLVLKISQSGGNLDFEWNSMDGMQYDLLTSTDLATPVSTWSVYDDGVNPPYEDIPSTGIATTLSGVVKVGPVRFFAIREEQLPPLFSEGFEAGLPIDWSTGDNGAGTIWEVGTPAAGPTAAATGTNCAGTNLSGDYTSNADATLTSPAIPIPAGGANLTFQQFIDSETGYDYGTVRILDADDGDAEIIDGSFPVTPIEGNSGWTQQSFPLPAGALGKNIKVQFQFVSDVSNEFTGFFIDDFQVTSTP